MSRVATATTPTYAQRWVMLAALVLAALAALPATAEEDVPAEQLLIFVQQTGSEVAQDFETKHLAKVKELAEEMGVSVQVVDITEGPAPAEVGITPLVAYQNHLGRSIYQGRYATMDRLRNFIVTSRFMPQGDEPRKMADAIGMTNGRSTVVMPLKVTDLAGAPPEGYDHAALVAQVRTAFKEKPMLAAGALGDVELGRSDRLFYVDLYPYRSEDGTLYLSLAVFSQFHCHDPVFTTGGEPIAGPWDERNAVIERAVRQATREVLAQINGSKIGDGFDAVPADKPTVSWEDMGFTLPPKPEGAVDIDPSTIELVGEWAVDTEAQKRRPAVTFAFPAPLDNYSGRVKKLTGELTLGEGLGLPDASGKFVVPIEAVTMGDEILDGEIVGWLKGKDHPESSFTFDNIETGVEVLVFGEVIPGVLVGRFEMKGIGVDLRVPVSVEAIIGSDGKPRVTIDGQWTIDIADPFGVAGPDGPADVRNQLVYRCHILLAPKQP